MCVRGRGGELRPLDCRFREKQRRARWDERGVNGNENEKEQKGSEGVSVFIHVTAANFSTNNANSRNLGKQRRKGSFLHASGETGDCGMPSLASLIGTVGWSSRQDGMGRSLSARAIKLGDPKHRLIK